MWWGPLQPGHSMGVYKTSLHINIFCALCSTTFQKINVKGKVEPSSDRFETIFIGRKVVYFIASSYTFFKLSECYVDKSKISIACGITIEVTARLIS